TVNGTSVTSGTASGNIALSVGANIITVDVTAQDGTTTRTYTVTVTRAASGDAALSGLVISQGTLLPAFAGGTYTYTASVANSVYSLTVTPTTSDVNATVTVNGTTVTSGTASPDISLSVGDNTITIIVMAQNSDTQTYTVTVTRAASGGRGSGGGSGTTYYTITASAGTGGSISPSGSSSVAYGDNKTYTITADDGYEIEDVLVDGVSVGAVSTYTFENVKKAHTIRASFKETETDAGSFNPFSDVYEDDWFYENVIYAYENGLMTGTGSDMFSPNSTMTRAMVVTVLYRMSGATGSNTNAFSDVSSGAWYENAVAWAAANGIASGVGGNRFAPDSAVSREQFAVMLYNYAKYKGLDVSIGDDTNITSYNDVLSISDYAYTALLWACGTAIINGDGNSNLNPQSSATRAEVAAMLQRFIENVIN
ncbi:MAG: S-layer homology domain-containing protein, partial [Dehalobacterium sp.]